MRIIHFIFSYAAENLNGKIPKFPQDTFPPHFVNYNFVSLLYRKTENERKQSGVASMHRLLDESARGKRRILRPRPDWTNAVTCVRRDARCVHRYQLWRKASDYTEAVVVTPWIRALLSHRMKYSGIWRTQSVSP